ERPLHARSDPARERESAPPRPRRRDLAARSRGDRPARFDVLRPPAELERGPMPARVGNILLGTASWTEKTLLASRTFYPPAANTPERRLRYYARHFGVVEVDASYYALPTSAQARGWVERTPSDFVFGVKAYAAMTGHPVELSR